MLLSCSKSTIFRYLSVSVVSSTPQLWGVTGADPQGQLRWIHGTHHQPHLCCHHCYHHGLFRGVVHLGHHLSLLGRGCHCRGGWGPSLPGVGLSLPGLSVGCWGRGGCYHFPGGEWLSLHCLTECVQYKCLRVERPGAQVSRE